LQWGIFRQGRLADFVCERLRAWLDLTARP